MSYGYRVQWFWGYRRLRVYVPKGVKAQKLSGQGQVFEDVLGSEGLSV